MDILHYTKVAFITLAYDSSFALRSTRISITEITATG